MNNFPGLTWEFEDPSDKVNFMDLTITIQNGHIATSLFEKPLNLHLYIPPHSAHPPGILPGIVHSTLFHIFTLCSDHNQQKFATLDNSGFLMADVPHLDHQWNGQKQHHNNEKVIWWIGSSIACIACLYKPHDSLTTIGSPIGAFVGLL